MYVFLRKLCMVPYTERRDVSNGARGQPLACERVVLWHIATVGQIEAQ
jgi:hypothetical protein